MTAAGASLTRARPELPAGPPARRLLAQDESALEPRRRYCRESSPWPAADVVRSIAIATLGLIGLLGCFYGSSREVLLDDQSEWILGAITASVVSALGMVSFLTTGFREIRRGVREVTDDLAELSVDSDLHARDASSSRVNAPDAVAEGSWVVVDGFDTAHRSNCLLVVGKAVRPLAQEADASYGRCGVCTP